MMKCPSCSLAFAEESASCPSCGVSLGDSFADTRILTDAHKSAQPEARTPRRQNTAGSIHTTASSTLDSIDNARFIPGTTLLERYRIVSLLGQGGMGEVYRADDLKLKQAVALKFLPENLMDDGATLARFHNEVSIARQISHRNVCRVYDIGEIEGQHFLSMEYIRGEELSSLLKRIGRLPSDKATEIARQLCAGLAAAHERGVLHRDLKPANVMIDDAGNVRITDFGLAGLIEDLREDNVIAGTPGYMSPEQLAGRELTVKSDIYSLGLVLYEIFTGRKGFEAGSVIEMITLRKSDASPTSPAAIVKDLDPLVEKVILRCLEKDPEKRPASALQVAAALPGGDPLAAALAAGETPSPEMVAAAPKEGSLSPALALACLASALVLLAAIVLLSGRVMLHRQVTLEKSRDALKDRAIEVIKRLGYTSAPTDSAYGFHTNGDYLRYVKEHDRSPARWDNLKSNQPDALHFWYRQSPRYMTPMRPSHRVASDDPPPVISGMALAELDPNGRLIYFDAVPPQMEEQGHTATEAPDWSILFREAGLDQASFKQVESKWVPPYNSDVRAAWDGTYPGRADIPLHIEAAGFAGRPIYFQLLGPWRRPSRMQEQPVKLSERIANISIPVIFLLVVGAGIMLARHNLRLGRGDRKGAFRLAAFVFATFMFSWVLNASHIPTQAEFNLLIQFAEFAVFVTSIGWLFYISLEPYVRRWWPHRIISWSRLLAGGWRDPLVGRDVLVGGLFGLVMTLLAYMRIAAPRWLGMAPPVPNGITAATLLGTRLAVGNFFYNDLNFAIFLSLIVLFLLLLFRIMLRRDWLAVIVSGLITIVILTLDANDNLPLDLTLSVLVTAIVFFVLMRFGLLALITTLAFAYLCSNYPITSDFSAWYADGALFALLLMVALAAYGFYAALAGEKLFKGRLLED